ncbi:MAG: hypothetical protein FWF45_06180 [Coriobacteriia bacterium]|nr:hypothetical protein [Coriobacteriia bacterium]
MGHRGRAGRRPGGCLGLVQGAIITDLIPRYSQSVGELDRSIRETAIARLGAAGLDLEAVGHQYYATALAITGRVRAALSTDEREALGKAIGALGWRAPEIALLCTPELAKPFSAEILAAYAHALNAEALILLERDLLPEPPQIGWAKIAACDDFFGSLPDQNEKRTAWIQLQAARRTLALID